MIAIAILCLDAAESGAWSCGAGVVATATGTGKGAAVTGVKAGSWARAAMDVIVRTKAVRHENPDMKGMYIAPSRAKTKRAAEAARKCDFTK